MSQDRKLVRQHTPCGVAFAPRVALVRGRLLFGSLRC